MPEQPVAGWYPDPYGHYVHRYWDGSRWTHHVAPQGPAAKQPSVPSHPFMEMQGPLQTPTFAGWYPDPSTRGTAYWDGSRWTGDSRPRRRKCAAASKHDGPGF